MPTYVVLYRFTDQGRKGIKDTVKRAAQVRRENQQRGFRVIGTWWTQGRYDLVAVVEAPSEDAMMGGLCNIAVTGNVSSEALRAFTQTEMRGILKQTGAAPTRPSSRTPARRQRASRARRP